MFTLVAAVALCFGLGALLGAPYLPVRRGDAEAALDLAGLKAGETLVDLGSGDGRMLAAAARRGAKAIGYEINPLLWLWSVAATWRYRRQVTVKLKSYWSEALPEADVVYTFLLDRYMERLHRKLQTELKRPARVVSYVFALPQTPVKQTRNTFLYQYPKA